MFIHRIKLENILSFGPDAQELELRPLNVLIGANGSGKSNFIEVMGLLKAAPWELTSPINNGGGVGQWLWQGQPKALSAHVEAIVTIPFCPQRLRHRFGFMDLVGQCQLTDERIENEEPAPSHKKPYIYFQLQEGRAVLNYEDGGQRDLRSEDFNLQQSVLAQRKDLYHYPELTRLGLSYQQIHVYREWCFGRRTPARWPQKSDLPNHSLIEDGQNLGLVLNRLIRDLSVKEQLLNSLSKLYEGVSDFHVNIEYGAVQVFLREGENLIPATRLSDGTLRYLCLLAILCHPTPPPLVCIEEPELGLHPDILPGIAELLREASERCQLIVTTHSDVLVDALTETPESIVVCEKQEGQTTLKRLDKDDLAHWLEKYRLGELWTSGELGGNRW